MDKPKSVLVLGHSYVRRLGEFVHQSSWDVSPNFGLKESQGTVYFAGYGGASVHRIHALLREVLERFMPDVVVLQVGSNDVRSNGDDPEYLADRLLGLARRLRDEFGITNVIVSQLFFRTVVPCQHYNGIIHEINLHLENKLQDERYLSFWKHFGFWNPEVRALLQHQDGVHFNDLGNYKFYKSLRGAILKACKQ